MAYNNNNNNITLFDFIYNFLHYFLYYYLPFKLVTVICLRFFGVHMVTGADVNSVGIYALDDLCLGCVAVTVCADVVKTVNNSFRSSVL